jgi:polyisoprenoid-binding protein YceI
MLRVRSLVFAVAWLAALPLAAQSLTFELDPAETSIVFRFGATMHSVQGSVRAEEGRIELDPGTGAASGRIVIDMKSATTGNARRDRKMHQKILETERYPQAVFTLDRISGGISREGRSDLQLHGTLELHGASHEVAVLAKAVVEGDRVTATGSLTIPYVEWGLDDPSFFVLRVEKQVRVEIKAIGRLSG